ncbi:MAG: prolyl oligopeptidase family serine peptidase [Planctomycetota bacterium]|jgi:poly(3-hydroxybutyrate) depolymerase
MRYFAIVFLASVALVTGCAVTQPENTPVPHRFQRDPVTGQGFFIYVPSTYHHSRPAPVVVTCHGSPPFDVAQYHVREWKMIGEQNGCIIVAPVLQGTEGILGDGPLVGMWENERRIMSIISLLGYRYNVDRANIMITGFSGGGFPTYWVGLRHPDVFSAVVARSCNFNSYNIKGWYPPDAKDTPIYVYYGENETAAITIQSRNAIEFLQAEGFKVESRIIPRIGHDRRPDVAMEFFSRNLRPPRPSLADDRSR